MHRISSRFGLPALVLAASLLTSCSYITTFVVVNEGPAPVTVTWTFVTPQVAGGPAYCPLTEVGYDPAIGAIVGSRLWGDRFERRAPAPNFTLDADACRATATVHPGSTLRLHREVNFVETNSQDQGVLDRLGVLIEGPAGTLTIEPGQALQRMTRRADLLYALASR